MLRKLLTAAGTIALAVMLVGCLPQVDLRNPDSLTLAVQSETETLIVFQEASTVYEVVFYIGRAESVRSLDPRFVCERFGRAHTCEIPLTEPQVLEAPVEVVLVATSEDPLGVSAVVWYSVPGLTDRISRQAN